MQKAVVVAARPRLGGTLASAFLLAGVWGLVYYLRWVWILAAEAPPAAAPVPEQHQAVIGKWAVAGGSDVAIGFTGDGKFIFYSGRHALLVGDYEWTDDGEIIVKMRPRNSPCLFRVSITEDHLSVTAAANRKGVFRADEFVLPPPRGKTLLFERRN